MMRVCTGTAVASEQGWGRRPGPDLRSCQPLVMGHEARGAGLKAGQWGEGAPAGVLDSEVGTAEVGGRGLGGSFLRGDHNHWGPG